MWLQREIKLPSANKGFHIVTKALIEQMPELEKIKIGLLHIFIKHTSASITINENADPTVRVDMENYLNKIVPEDAPYYKHVFEGSDDMPAHIRASLLGSSVTIPVTNGKLNLGTWQGIYLGEHRNYGGQRKLVITITGEEF